MNANAINITESTKIMTMNVADLLTAQDVPALDGNSAILTDLTLYDERTGLTLEPETGKALLI